MRKLLLLVAVLPAAPARAETWRERKRHMHCRPTARFDFVGFRLVMEVE